MYLLSVSLFMNDIVLYWNDGIFCIFLLTIIFVHIKSFSGHEIIVIY